jgi:hypothetical protein
MAHSHVTGQFVQRQAIEAARLIGVKTEDESLSDLREIERFKRRARIARKQKSRRK